MHQITEQQARKLEAMGITVIRHYGFCIMCGLPIYTPVLDHPYHCMRCLAHVLFLQTLEDHIAQEV